MKTKPYESNPDYEETDYAAEMTDRQFRSLHRRIVSAETISELRQLKRVKRPHLSTACDAAALRRWLRNGWNTEHIFSLSRPVLTDAGGAVLQWAFPQAYYAVFAHVLAFFQVAGFTEFSHAAVQRKFAELVLAGEYPRSIGFVADGTKRNMTFSGLAPHDLTVSSLQYDPADPGSWDRHIQQFLKSTRERRLDEKKSDLRLKTKAGRVRKAFREKHWEIASNKLGPTSLLCLLYRKRIKANYRDIDTFTVSDLDPCHIYDSLATIIQNAALIHESFIAAAVGWGKYSRTAEEYLETNRSQGLRERLAQQVAVLGNGAA